MLWSQLRLEGSGPGHAPQESLPWGAALPFWSSCHRRKTGTQGTSVWMPSNYPIFKGISPPSWSFSNVAFLRNAVGSAPNVFFFSPKNRNSLFKPEHTALSFPGEAPAGFYLWVFLTFPSPRARVKRSSQECPHAPCVIPVPFSRDRTFCQCD